MKLSIIIPTFNSGAVLSKALNSIVSQTFSDWEVLIMDGLSTDNTIEIAQSYNDNRIRIYSEPDKGIYDAMNKGIKKAQGEWLYFLGSDDWLLNENVLNEVLVQCGINSYDVVYGEVDAPHLASNHSGEWSLQTIDRNRCHQAIFYRREVVRRFGGYNTKYKIWADYDLNLKWFFNKNVKKKHIPTVIAHYSEGGYSSICDAEMLKDLSWILLARGRKMYTVEEKKELIHEALLTETSPLKRRVLKLWQLSLTTKKQ